MHRNKLSRAYTTGGGTHQGAVCHTTYPLARIPRASGQTARTADMPVHAPRACVDAKGAVQGGSGERSAGMREILPPVEWKGTGVDVIFLYTVCGICLPPRTSDSVMIHGKRCHSIPARRYLYLPQKSMFVRKRHYTIFTRERGCLAFPPAWR